MQFLSSWLKLVQTCSFIDFCLGDNNIYNKNLVINISLNK